MEEKHEKIEYILERLREPERLLEEEFVSWLQEGENKRVFEEVITNRMAFLQKEYDQQVEPEKEWQRLWKQVQEENHTPKTGRRKRKVGQKIWYTVAAGICILLALAGGWLLQQKNNAAPTPLAKAEHVGKRSAELIVSTGETIDLSRLEFTRKVVDGALITNDTMKMLSYREDSGRITGKSPTDKKEKTSRDIVYHTLRIPAGADYQVTLADGTKVWLNCESTLRYPVEFGEEQREVFLDGEGYFEVNKAAEWPFIVNTEEMKVRVTGTKFNVKSYSTEPVVHATLVEGSVRAYTDHTRVQLTPSEQFRLDKMTGETSVRKVDTEVYTGWTEGMFVFRNQRMEEVMNDLARWYKMTVFYSSSEVKDIHISANLGRYENIDDLLEIINESGKVVAIRKENTITIHSR